MAEDTKARILRVTRALIDKKGLSAVTLRAVGAEGGLSRGAAYRHFTNKDDLLAAIAIEDFEMLMKNFEELEKSHRHPANLLTEVLLRYYTFGISNRVHYQLMFTTPWAPEDYPLLQQKGEAAFQRINRLIISVLEANAIATGDAARRTAIMFSFIHGLVELHLAGHTEKVKALDDARKLIIDFVQLISAK